jgi:hypothetical protein
MKWVVVTLDENDLRVLGPFESEHVAYRYCLDAFGREILLAHVSIRPLLDAVPIA